MESQPGNVHSYALPGQVKAGAKIHFLTNPENLGYSNGNNKGIEFASDNNADYVLLLNPDTEVESDMLAKLVEKAESNSGIGIVGPAIDEGAKIIYGGKVQWLKPELLHNESHMPDSDFFLTGAAMLIKKDVFKKIGLLDERYFIYFEDVDFCMRARRAGYLLHVVPDALVYHQVSTATSKLGSARLLYYHYRNAHLFNQKNGPFPVKLVLPIWSFFIIIRQLLKLLFAPAKRAISYSILKGVNDFYQRNFGRLD